MGESEFSQDQQEDVGPVERVPLESRLTHSILLERYAIYSDDNFQKRKMRNMSKIKYNLESFAIGVFGAFVVLVFAIVGAIYAHIAISILIKFWPQFLLVGIFLFGGGLYVVYYRDENDRIVHNK